MRKKIGYFVLAYVFTALSIFSAQAQYSIYTDYGDLTECSNASSGPFLIWWDKDENFAAEANTILGKLMEYRQECLDELGMMDPPNALAGAYINIYAHTPNGFFGDKGFGCGVGTEQYGTAYRGPFLACSADTLLDDSQTRAHELFHLMQYSSTSPGYVYSGNSGWYTEASANYYAIMKYPEGASDYANAVILKKLPHVPLWLSFQNLRDSSYPDNWQRNVHQYAIHLFLQYMSVEKGVPLNVFTDGYYAGTSLLPQEYIANQIGITNFRNHFIDFVSEVHNNYSFMTASQLSNAEINWNTYSDSADQNEFILTLNNSGTDGWFQPSNTVATTGWSYNAYKLLNNKNTNYTFQLKGDATGTNGDASYFKAKILVKNSAGTVSFYNLPMSSDQNGTINIELSATDTEIIFLVASLPSKLSDDTAEFQVYPYQVNISEDDTITTTCDWSTIAEESEIMSFSGTKLIRYGANGVFITKEISGGTICNNSTFGDPIPNVKKTCEECNGNATTEFIPDPSKTYYIDSPVHNVRLAATGASEEAYTTSINTTGDNVQWQFVAKGNGSWHLQRAAGGTKPRLRTDNSENADMQETTSSGTFTYYDMESTGSGNTYFFTLPDGPSNYQRLQINSNGEVKMVTSSHDGSWESFTITEAGFVNNSGASTLVHMTKRNATGFAIDGNNGAADFQEIYLWEENDANVNQQWIEIDRGGGYYSYQKEGTDYCIDGNNGGSNNQSVYLYTCGETNNNQHWQKVDAGGGAYKLIKRNALGYALNGGNGGTNTQAVNLYDSSVTSQNLHWYITPIDTSAKAIDVIDADKVVIYPNPAGSIATLRGAENSIIRIYDMSGRTLLSGGISNESETLDLSLLPSGIYYAEIHTETQIIVKKIVKE